MTVRGQTLAPRLSYWVPGRARDDGLFHGRGWDDVDLGSWAQKSPADRAFLQVNFKINLGKDYA